MPTISFFHEPLSEASETKVQHVDVICPLVANRVVLQVYPAQGKMCALASSPTTPNPKNIVREKDITPENGESHGKDNGKSNWQLGV